MGFFSPKIKLIYQIDIVNTKKYLVEQWLAFERFRTIFYIALIKTIRDRITLGDLNPFLGKELFLLIVVSAKSPRTFDLLLIK